MEEINKFTQREELKTYFETGKYPTESQFGRFIDNYVHLNEFNFGLEIKPTGTYNVKNYHFYLAQDRQHTHRGHLTVENTEGNSPEQIDGYYHVLTRNIGYKLLNIKLSNNLDFDKHQPKIIIKRYKQKKNLRSGFMKSAGFYQELTKDAESWGRQSEYPVKSAEMVLDINPVHYFRPGPDYRDFYPAGTFSRPGSFRHSVHHRKPYSLIQMLLEINVNGTTFRSNPVTIKIVLGREESDVITYIINQ
ncbi:hypothetical protein [Chryseobacterium salviniae]|uniref:Uncharacterized protein n=1 Tax=Chryseobacterium salviniae TaxID=3101750 RepID=A0ABU6HNM6_9FLAO|nr:hypothetical protein [Chryseobacterium sp. T9W2-O]MEC3874319.1 hypothetical protein [Chryseobacterium sp. T9W2-O]